jgi:hypothetical protein
MRSNAEAVSWKYSMRSFSQVMQARNEPGLELPGIDL